MDWLCLPRFDSDACFAALLGTREHGYWRISPVSEVAQSRRRYLPHTPILETTFKTEDGTVTLVDFMPLSDDPEKVDVIRLVRGVSGRVSMRMDFVLRFGYGRTIPWVRRRDYGIHAVAGPDAVELVTPVPLHSKDMRTTAEFEVAQVRCLKASVIGSVAGDSSAAAVLDLRANPDNVQKRERLFDHYLFRKDWLKLNPHLLWAIDHQKNERQYQLSLRRPFRGGPTTFSSRVHSLLD